VGRLAVDAVGHGFFIGNPFRLWRTVDGGHTWHQIGLPGI
jgi:photosystem II stability/assembly factor-like uncharacterized protein